MQFWRHDNHLVEHFELKKTNYLFCPPVEGVICKFSCEDDGIC